MDFKVGDEVGVIDDKGRVRGPYTIIRRAEETNGGRYWQHQWLLSNYLPIYESMLVRWYPGLSKDYGPIPSREEIEELRRKINREVRNVYELKTGQSGEAGTSPANLIGKFAGIYKPKKRGRNNNNNKNNNRVSKKLTYNQRKNRRSRRSRRA